MPLRCLGRPRFYWCWEQLTLSRLQQPPIHIRSESYAETPSCLTFPGISWNWNLFSVSSLLRPKILRWLGYCWLFFEVALISLILSARLPTRVSVVVARNLHAAGACPLSALAACSAFQKWFIGETGSFASIVGWSQCVRVT